MEKVTNDKIMTFNEKKALLKEMKQDDLIEVFQNYKSSYKPISRKKSPLDQQIAAGITEQEKKSLQLELTRLKNMKDDTVKSKSSFIRNKVISEIDIADWAERASRGLNELKEEKWDRAKVLKKLNDNISFLENAEDGDTESEYIYKKTIEECEKQLQELDRPTIRRGYKISGRITFNEANHIRWRAARLTLTVADYVRFMLFGYVPNSEADRHLSIEARKRFYVSILDVAKNGWGKTPHIENCENCARYADEAKAYKLKLERLQNLLDKQG